MRHRAGSHVTDRHVLQPGLYQRSWCPPTAVTTPPRSWATGGLSHAVAGGLQPLVGLINKVTGGYWWLRVLVGGLPGGRVLVGEVADGDGLAVVGGAQAAVVDADAGAVAVVAPLSPEVAEVTLGAAVDGDVASWGARGQRDDRWEVGCGVAASPRVLPAGGCAVPLASDRGERAAPQVRGRALSSRCRHGCRYAAGASLGRLSSAGWIVPVESVVVVVVVVVIVWWRSGSARIPLREWVFLV
jgi:hypothetical protein